MSCGAGLLGREEFVRAARRAGHREQDWDAAYGAYLDEATWVGATGCYRRAVDEARAVRLSDVMPGVSAREAVGLVWAGLEGDPTAAGHARRTQPFYEEPRSQMSVAQVGQRVRELVTAGKRLGIFAADEGEELEPLAPPAYTVGRYGGVYSWTWGRRRWWDLRGWSILLAVRLEEWWFGDDLHAEAAAREWAGRNPVVDFYSPEAWKRACRGVVYAAMAERRRERRARWRAMFRRPW